MTNVFAVIIHTPALNNKGIPHILERLVMCGNQNIPIKDPLAHMTETRSMNIFQEPQLGLDYTCFPF